MCGLAGSSAVETVAARFAVTDVGRAGRSDDNERRFRHALLLDIDEHAMRAELQCASAPDKRTLASTHLLRFVCATIQADSVRHGFDLRQKAK